MYGRLLAACLGLLIALGGLYPALAGGSINTQDLVCAVLLAMFWGPALRAELPDEFKPSGNSRPLPVLQFEPNFGQTDRRYDWLSRGTGFFLFLNGEGAAIDLRDDAGRPRGLLRVAYEGGRSGAASEPGEYRSQEHYLLGNDASKWVTDVPVFGTVSYRQVYPGIDITYYQNGGLLEHDWIVRAGADPGVIRMRFGGADEVRADGDGNLLLRTGGVSTVWHAPRSYERRSGRAVASRWRFHGDGTVGFQLGAYNRSDTLVIDPAIQYLSYVGRTGTDVVGRAATDAQGNLYFTGTTTTGDWPVTPGAAMQNSGGFFPNNSFATKMSADGSQVLFSTIFGGAQVEGATGVAVDPQGSILLTGVTVSDDFPTTANALQRTTPSLSPTDPDATNCYVIKLNSAGTAPVYSTYLGAEKIDACYAIATDGQGNAYIAGSTNSLNLTTTPDVVQPRYRLGTENPSHDIFVVKLSPGGERVYGTYIGGSGHDAPYGMTVDSAGAVYLAGSTTSTNFPVTSGAAKSSFGGRGGLTAPLVAGDGFVLKLAPDAKAIAYATYLGGSRDDMAIGIAVDGQGNAYVAGNTLSSDFPISASALQRQWRGAGGQPILPAGDSFVTKLNPQGTQLVYSTLLGGSQDDRAMAVAVDSQGAAWVAGHTLSTDFPVTPDAAQGQNRTVASSLGQIRLGDGFVAHLTPQGDRLNYSTYLGGSGHDAITALVMSPDGGPMVVGITSSSDLSTTAGAYQTRNFGGVEQQVPFDELFIAKFGAATGVSLAGIANAASYSQNAVSPGMIVTLAGSGIGPEQLTLGNVVSGRYSTNIGGTQIFFDNTPAPIIYVSSGQSSVVAPYDVAGKQTVQVTVDRGGTRSAPLTVNVVTAAPGLFSANSSGQGPGAILNQNNSVNSPQNPADPESVIILYGTGEGTLTNQPTDGALVGTPLPVTPLPVRVTIAGREGSVLYAGGAPGLVAGVFQVNVKMPPNVPSGNQPVVVTVGTASSQNGLTVAVR